MIGWKRILAIGLSTAMLFGSLPTPVFAKEDSFAGKTQVSPLSGEETEQAEPENEDLPEEAELMEGGAVPAAVTPSGDGTKSSPLVISNLGNLIYFCRYLYGNSVTYITFGNNIYINDPIDWKSVIEAAGRSEKYVQSLFPNDAHSYAIDGKGYSIYGLDIPLMYEARSSTVISNLNLRESAVSGDYRSALVIENYGKIENCKVTGTGLSLSGGYFGPICYNNYDTGIITKCTNEASVTGTGSSTKVGGICCENNGTIQNCVNKGKLTAPYVGGIVWAEEAYLSKPHSIQNCVNYGDLSAVGAGGIAYKADPYAQISGCSNFGSITGNAPSKSDAVTLGGICGTVSGSTTQSASITGCASFGDITCDSTSSYAKLGGIAAEVQAAHIEKCYVEGMDTDRIAISSVGGTIGGLVGLAKLSAQITNCYARADLSGGATGGGLIGSIENSASADHSYSVSVQKDVGTRYYTSGSLVGKVTGSSGERKLDRCYYDKTLNANSPVGTGAELMQLTNCDGKTTTQFASGSVRDLLNTLSGSKQDVWCQETSGAEKDPYPVLSADGGPIKPVRLYETEGIHFLYYTKQDGSIVLDKRETVYLTADTQNLLTGEVSDYENSYVWVKVTADTDNNRSVVEKIMPVETRFGLLSEIRAERSVVVGETVYDSTVDFNAADVNSYVLIFLQNGKIAKYAVLKKIKLQTIGNITEKTIGIDGVALTVGRGCAADLNEKAAAYKEAIAGGSKDTFYYLEDSNMLLYEILREEYVAPPAPTYTLIYHSSNALDKEVTSVREVGDNSRLAGVENLNFVEPGTAFSHWTTRPKGKGVKFNDGADIRKYIKENITIDLYANYRAIKYRIVYDPNGATGAKKSQNCSGAKTVKIASSKYKRTGYTQKGWVDNSGKEYGFNQKVSALATEDDTTVILRANWVENTYTVKYYANKGTLMEGKSAPEPQTVRYSEILTLSENVFERPGYQFVSWNTNKKGTGAGYPENVTVSKKATKGEFSLYAKWKVLNDGNISLSFDPNGGSIIPDVTVKKNKSASLKKPTRGGYVFRGWEAPGGKVYAPGASFAWNEEQQGQNLRLTAKWDPITYSIKLVANNETTDSEVINCSYDQGLTVDARSFEYPGHDLTGWNTKADGTGTQYDAGIALLNLSSKQGAAITLYAQWIDTDPAKLRAYYVEKLYRILQEQGVCHINGAYQGGAFTATKEEDVHEGVPYYKEDWCPNCELKKIVKADWFVNSGLIKEGYTAANAGDLMNAFALNKSGECWSCFAFATFAEWYAFSGGDPSLYAKTEKVIGAHGLTFDADNLPAIKKYCQKGDWISMNGHAGIYYDADASGIYLLDSNAISERDDVKKIKKHACVVKVNYYTPSSKRYGGSTMNIHRAVAK